MPDLDAIKAKIRALLAKTVENGCTEGEALAAAEKAFAMLKEHGLSEDHLDIGRAGSSLGRSRRQPIDDLWPIVAAVCRCRCLVVQVGRSHEAPLRMDFIGRAPWPEIADWLRGALQAAHGRALAQFRATPAYQRRRLSHTRAAARRQFTIGFVAAVKHKLSALVTNWNDLKHELQIVDQASAADFAGTQTLATLGKPSLSHNTARDREAGQEAGFKTPVNWAVPGRSASKAIGNSSR